MADGDAPGQGNAALPPGSIIGILGGGQLGRMLANAAAELGFACHIYCPDADSPAFDVARDATVAEYEDDDALRRFAASVDVVTYEFENVPSSSVEVLEEKVPVRPGARSLEIAQDRLAEKKFAVEIRARTAPFHAIGAERDLDGIRFEGRYVLKTRRFGYDGKGQAIVESRADAETAFAGFGRQPCILEAFVPFEREISVVLARGYDGAVAAFEPVHNVHRDHILWQSRVPAGVSGDITAEAVRIASAYATALNHVGAMAVEFFVSVADPESEGSAASGLLVNEIAPRVHNSGHWTQDGAAVSQFAQHIRAIAGWPLAEARTLGPTIMTNLIGAEADDWARLAAEPNACLHLYGKRETRPGRKMGHVNRVSPG